MGMTIDNIWTAREKARELNGDVYLYGTGFCAKTVYYFLKKQMIHGEVKGFLQTKRTKEQVFGLPVITVWEFSKLAQKELCVIVAVQDKYQEEIIRTLTALRISNYCGIQWGELAASINGMEEVKKAELWEMFPWYCRLQDAESRLVFTYAALAKLSCDIRYYLHMQKKSITSEMAERKGVTLADWVRSGRYLEEKENFLYVPSQAMLNYFGPRFLELGISLRGICSDQYLLQEMVWKGLPVVSLEMLAGLDADANVLIGCGQRSLSYHTLEKFQALGFEKEKILLPCSMDNPFQYGLQYFDLPEFLPGTEEVFVDAGCYDCDTVREFIELTKGQYKQIYSFEPDKQSYDRCKNISRNKQYQRFTLWNKGVWSEETTLRFNNQGTALSKVSETGGYAIETVALDHALENEKVTMIKMDIEGAEFEALRGCENIIRSQKPRLAISVYHKSEDFVDIPAYLLSLVPEYKLYYRHYSLYKYETILYAVVE